MFRSSNPAITRLAKMDNTLETGTPASYVGVSLKAIYFAIMTFVSAILIVSFLPQLIESAQEVLIICLIIAPIAALICALVASRAPSATPLFGTLYAIFEGAMLGIISLFFEAEFQGIVVMALLSTVVIFLVMMLLYSTGIIKVGGKFRRVVMSALIAVIVSQLLFLLLSLFIPSIAAAYANNFALQLIITILMIVLAAAMILIDLDNITMIVQNRMPKKYEWLAAFGLIITLIWLYLQMLRLLALVMRRK